MKTLFIGHSYYNFPLLQKIILFGNYKDKNKSLISKLKHNKNYKHWNFKRKVNRMYKNHWRRNKQGYSKLKQQVKSVLDKVLRPR